MRVLWSQGHRPFFLLAALLAALWMPWWLAVWSGLASPPAYLAPAPWHAHEMLFGYLAAVLAGFLLLGTGGWRLATLAALWLAGRLAMAGGGALLPGWAVAALDFAFLPALALLRTPAFWRSLKWPTIGFPVLLAGFLAGNLLFHLEALGLLREGASLGRRLMLDLVVLMVVVMGGRLVPGYTRAIGIPVRRPQEPGLERASVALGLALAAATLAGLTMAAGVAALGLGLLQLVRVAGWGTASVRDRPLLWILHAGYGWLILALLLRAAAELTPWIGPTEALHALTVGAVGALTLGMMTRLARVHGRRPLAVGPATIASYALLLAAAALRSVGPIVLAPEALPAVVTLAGLAWSLAFGLFLLADGRLLLAAGGTKSRPTTGPRRSAGAPAGRG